MEQLSSAGYPTFLTGDFNEPSSLDYTDETVGSRGRRRTGALAGQREPSSTSNSSTPTARCIPIPLPCLDSRTTTRTSERGAQARIDFVYAGGPLETIDSELVGEEGDPNVEMASPVDVRPSRCGVAFEVTPVALPTTVSLDRRMLTQGDTFTVRTTPAWRIATSVEVDLGRRSGRTAGDRACPSMAPVRDRRSPGHGRSRPRWLRDHARRRR